MCKRKSANAAVVTNQRMPQYLDLSVQRAKYTKFLIRRDVLREYAARLVGLNSFDDSRKKQIVVFWGSLGMKRFGRFSLPGARYHPACKQLLQYVQQIATVYVSHEKVTSNHCSDSEQIQRYESKLNRLTTISVFKRCKKDV
ncbi:hypothetical protein MP228_006370 [Amoeboaphelidium protococcarum]|nr:hypothetical protein MP228_006370 [Amoeboaphelidium protococcarum]